MPVCPATLVGSDRALEADTRMLPPAQWLSLLVRGVDRSTMLPPEDPHECSGLRIGLEWPDERSAVVDPRSDARPLPARPLTDADMTFGEGPDGQVLIWARITYFDDGTALGPVALARWVERGVEIRGIGTLWAPQRRARLRIEPLGEDAQLLVADGERCTGEDLRSCIHEIYLLPLVNQRFTQAELVVDDTPAGPARVVSVERRDTPLPDGWVRRSDVQRRLRLSGDSTVISELIRIRVCDPKNQPEMCQEEYRAEENRPLAWKDGRFTTSRSAWDDTP
ncbi:MAG TPA: hypothetical protein VGB85_06745 [Nannocystis sp.]